MRNAKTDEIFYFYTIFGRNNKCRNNYTREKPTIVLNYNVGKCAIDLSDRMIAYSTPHRKTLKWCIKLAIELLLNTSVTNALLFYKLTTNRKIKISDFRMAMHLTQCHDVEAPSHQIYLF